MAYDEEAEIVLAALGAVPDIGDTFRYEAFGKTESYRVTAWMRRRPAPPEPRTEGERIRREILDEMRAEGKISLPEGDGPDNVPLEFCLRHQAEYVCGSGVAGVIARVRDVRVTGRASCPSHMISAERKSAELLAGKPLR